MDADAQLDALVSRRIRVAVGHAALELYGTPRRIHCAGKFYEHAVACALDDAAAMLGHLGFEKFPAVGIETS